MFPASPPSLDTSFIRALIGPVEQALAGAPGRLDRKALARLSSGYLKPAEAMLRRFIWMLAGFLPKRPVPAPAAHPAALRAKPARRGKGPARPPAFRLTEPLTGLAGYAAPGPAERRPPPARPTLPAASLAAAEARLRRRLAALLHAASQPEAEAKRLAARAARGSWLTLDTVRIPGSRSRALPAHLKPVLIAMNDGALEAARILAAHYAAPPGADTS